MTAAEKLQRKVGNEMRSGWKLHVLISEYSAPDSTNILTLYKSMKSLWFFCAAVYMNDLLEVSARGLTVDRDRRFQDR